MKKNILLLFILSITNLFSVYSQTIDKLDEKRGFKDFKIGDNFNKWKQDLIFYSQNGSEINYSYNGICCNKIFDYEIDIIFLTFTNDKLVKIHLIHTDKPKKGSYISSVNPNKINYKLMEMFGKFTSKDMDKNSGKIYLFWLGKKVDILSVYEYLGASVGEKYEVVIMEKKYVSNNSEEGF